MKEEGMNGIDIIAKELFNLQKEYEKSFIKIMTNKNEDYYAKCLNDLKESYEKDFGKLARLITEYIHVVSLLNATGYEIENIDFYTDRDTRKYSIRLNVNRVLYEYSPQKYEEQKEKHLKKFFSMIEDDGFGREEIRIMDGEIEKLKNKHLYLSIDQAVNLDMKKSLMIVSDFGEIYVEVVGERVY
ncbi:MAG: hypothetical protein J7K83_00740 [Candidatus Aenigmarchaeota archaeon]|nr:hypothetical protein [Candidatus Aenigmarchaeota archaeon]